MKSFKNYILESKDCEWEERVISKDTIGKYRQEFHNWITKTYGAMNNESYVKALKDTYMDYVTADKKSSKRFDVKKAYDEFIRNAPKRIKEYGIPGFEEGCVGQGYFDYMHWFINKDKE